MDAETIRETFKGIVAVIAILGAFLILIGSALYAPAYLTQAIYVANICLSITMLCLGLSFSAVAYKNRMKSVEINLDLLENSMSEVLVRLSRLEKLRADARLAPHKRGS